MLQCSVPSAGVRFRNEKPTLERSRARGLACPRITICWRFSMRIPGHKVVLAAAACVLGSGSTLASPAASPAASSSAQAKPVSLHGVDLERSTIPEIQHAMDRGRLTSFELTVFYLGRNFQLNPSL